MALSQQPPLYFAESAPDMSWSKNDEPLRTDMILRTRSGSEEQVPAYTGRMPKAVRKQVFSSSFVIMANSWGTNLKIKDRQQRKAAIEQARHGGYRFELPQPVRVQFQRSSGGRLVVSGT